MIVRAMEPRDVPTALAIQARAPEIAQWSAGDYEAAGRDLTAAWVVVSDGSVVGFVVARRAADELEILNLAVASGARRRGAGTLLLKEATAWGIRYGAAQAHLEVRESNAAAIQFYKRHGFSVSGRRRRYYSSSSSSSSPIEDALVLSAPLAAATN